MGKTKTVLAVIAVAAALVAPAAAAEERGDQGQTGKAGNHLAAANTQVSLAAGSCPKARPQELPPDALAGATRAALAEAPGLYQGMKTRGRYAEAAYRGMAAPVNQFYKSACPGRLKYGRLLQKRSVQVNMIFPEHLPSASLSQHWVFVARFGGEYKVWGVYR